MLRILKITLLRVIPTMTFIRFVTGKSSGVLSGISSGIVQRCPLSSEGPRLRSSSAHWARKVPGWGPAVVQQCPLRAEVGEELARRKWTSKWMQRWWRRSWRTRRRRRRRRRRKRRRRRRTRRRRTTVIKSNNPHRQVGKNGTGKHKTKFRNQNAITHAWNSKPWHHVFLKNLCVNRRHLTHLPSPLETDFARNIRWNLSLNQYLVLCVLATTPENCQVHKGVPPQLMNGIWILFKNRDSAF